MGRRAPTGNELCSLLVSGTFTETDESGNAVVEANPNSGDSVPPAFQGFLNFALWGTFVATVTLEKSFDGGTTYQPVSIDGVGNPATYAGEVNLSIYEPELGVLYRWNCTDYTSGTVSYRISQ